MHKINALSPNKLAEVIDFIDFLAERENSKVRAERFSQISNYAIQKGGTEFDLDNDLEQAALENLLAIDEAKAFD
ncbi:MAG: toxin-antitoxin system, antitoxin component, Xre family protein [Acidobacteriota bacterium]